MDKNTEYVKSDTDKNVANNSDEILLRMLKTPPEPHKEMIGGSSNKDLGKKKSKDQ